MAGLFRSLIQSVAGLNSADFNDWVGERTGGRSHASFFEGDFAGAFQSATDPEARSGGRGLLLVWLHERDTEETQHLCVNVWTHAGVRAELGRRFVAWAGDIFRFDGSSLAQVLGAGQYPTLAILQKVPRGAPRALEWPRRCHFRVQQMFSGHISAQALHGILAGLADAVDAQRRQEVEYRQQLSQMQDMSRALMQAVEKVQVETQQRRERAEQLRCAEEEERVCFSALYESRHGMQAPPVFDGGFAEALASATAERRLLLVWLYAESSASDTLCRDVLSGEVFRAFVAEYFVLWPGHAERWLVPSQLRELLRLPAVPFLLVLRPLSVYEAEIVPWADPRAGAAVEFPADSAWSLVGAWDVTVAGGTDEEGVLSFLSEHGDRVVEEERRRVEERTRAQERAAAARQLREEQDRELQESLLIDQQRKALAQDDATTRATAAVGGAAAGAAAPPTQPLPPSATSAAGAEAALVASRRSAAKALLAAVPETLANGDRCMLVLRLPSGRRAQRNFRAAAPLSEVYAWADCCGELIGLQEGTASFEVPKKFTLVTTFPRAALQNMDKSLSELGLVPNAVLALCSDDD